METIAPAVEPQFLPRLGRHLAHELNNPISAIASAAYLIDDFVATADHGKVEGEQIKPFIDSIREECGKLKNIVEEFSRFVTTETILPMPVKLDEFLRTRLKDFAAKDASQSLEVSFHSSVTHDAIVSADLGQLQIVVQALLRQAIDAEATSVEVALSKPNRYYLITFKDNRKIPITEEEGRDLFDPLPKKRGMGLGLSLPLAKKIVTLHGGSIAVLPTKDGAEASLELPAVESR